MASSALLTVLVAALCVSSASAVFIGGATSVNDFMVKLVKTFGNGVGPYDSVGSAGGIANFTRGTYAIGVSDDPLNNAQNTAAGGKQKITVPLVEGLYALCTKKATGIKLKQSQIAGIYKGEITQWHQISSSLSGAIIPVARSDGSGTTELFNIWLSNKLGSGVWPYTGTKSWQGQAGIGRDVVFAAKSGGVAGYAAAHPNAICYVQAGVGVTQYGLHAAALLNPAGYYISPTGAVDPSQSIPRPLPPSDASWAAVTLLDKIGKGTYPVASFEYLFAKKFYGNSATASLVKRFLTFTQGSQAQGFAASYFFFKLPATVLSQSKAAINTIS